MADYPNDYLWQFYDMEIRTVANGVQYITVNKYLSGGSEAEKTIKNDVWKKLQSFFRDAKSKETGVNYQQGEWIVDPRLNPHGRVQYHWNKTLGPFNGKGTPDRYYRFLQAVDLWLTVGCKGIFRPTMWKSVPTLQAFADQYMGVDCNSFVGGYFETNYPTTGWDTSIGWSTKELKKGPKRKSISEIKPLDVLVEYKGQSKKHVAIVEDIWSKTGSQATILLTQSSSSKGGLSSDVCKLEITAGGNAVTSNGYSLDFNEGAYGVLGANS